MYGVYSGHFDTLPCAICRCNTVFAFLWTLFRALWLRHCPVVEHAASAASGIVVGCAGISATPDATELAHSVRYVSALMHACGLPLH